MGRGATALQARLGHAMRLAGEAGLDGWLIADFRWNNPLFGQLLDLHSGILTRRCFLWLPAAGHGEPAIVASRVDAHAVSGLDSPVILYEGYSEMTDFLRQALPAGGRIAMEYSPDGRLPSISRVDAGLIDLVRSLGVEVVSSGPFISALDRWSHRQQALHERAARGVDEARRVALERCGELLRRGERVTEGTLTAIIHSCFAERGLSAHDGPDVAAGANSADPHYSLDGEGAEITPDAVLLIDLWAKVRGEDDAPYADSTWMAYTGVVPPDLRAAFDAVRDGRDVAIAAIDQALQSGVSITGQEVDRVTREYFGAAGLGEHLIHRTGHSLGIDHVHGMGTNLDDIEFPDDRPLLPDSGFTVEPALYYPGRFGMRLEVSAILLPSGVRITTECQTELTIVRAD